MVHHARFTAPPQVVFFTVYGILYNTMTTIPDDKSPAKKQVSASATVLVVEDDSFISLFLEQKLNEMNYRTIVAATTGLAKQELERNQVDVILLDIILPDENGFSFLEKIKKDDQLRNIPVIILSNLGQQSEIERGRRLGAVDFLVKGNYSPTEIVERVAKILKSQHPTHVSPA